MWQQPIYDRTKADVSAGADKCYINAALLNRLEGNSAYLAELLGPKIQTKTWTPTDLLTRSEMERILQNIQTLRAKHPDPARCLPHPAGNTGPARDAQHPVQRHQYDGAGAVEHVRALAQKRTTQLHRRNLRRTDDWSDLMYERKVWVNRQSEHPARRKLTPTGNDGEYDVSRSEGIIMEDGDAFDADTMNDLERRVAAGFTEFDPTGAGGGEVTVQPYTCEKKNGVYALVGSGAVGRCKIPASWAAGDSFTVNGAAVPAYCGADAVDGDTIVKGRWVLFFYDGTQLNFNGGGGLSASKLALATATEDNVLAGNKFYAGSKTIKEGTLTLTGNVTADKMLEGSSGYADDAHSIVAGSMPNRGSWGASLSPGGVATVPSGYHNGSGQVTAVSLKTVTITMATGGGPWSYTFTGGTLVGIRDIARSGDSSEIGDLHISGNTITMEWSGNGIVNRQITLIYY